MEILSLIGEGLTLKLRRSSEAASDDVAGEHEDEPALTTTATGQVEQAAADLLLHRHLSKNEVMQWRLCGLR